MARFIEIYVENQNLEATVKFANGKIVCDDPGWQKLIDTAKLLSDEPEKRFEASPGRFSYLSRCFSPT